jgi:hypothetical protein
VPELQAGDPAWIGPFRLRERLGDGDGDGVGSLGPLYLGQSPLDHLVVVRTLHADLAADQGLRARLTSDVAAAREVSGPHVAPLVGADLSGPAPWIAWEWVPGESLAATVGGGPGNQHGPLPWPAFATLATQLADGIWSLHEAGVIHGDLTPGSVFLGKDGPVVTGFGVSAAVAALRAAAAALPADVLEFLSPEQAAGGESSPAGDMFSLGAVLAYALRGAGPYPVQARSGARHPIDYDQPDLDGIPDFLRPLIGRCLRADPDSRAPSDGFAALLAVTIRSAPRRVIAALTSPSTAVAPSAAAIPGATAPHGAVTPQPALASNTASPPTVPARRGQSSPPGGPPRRRPPIALIWSVVALTALTGIIWLSAATNTGPRLPVPGATQIYFSDYQAGDCLTGNARMNSDTPWPDLMWLVPCSGTHTYEVYYADFAHWPAETSFPGTAAVESAAVSICGGQFTQYTGMVTTDTVYSYWYVIPIDSASWAYGNRQLVCIAYFPTSDHPDGYPIIGSLKGAEPRMLAAAGVSGGPPPLTAVTGQGPGRKPAPANSPRNQGAKSMQAKLSNCITVTTYSPAHGFDPLTADVTDLVKAGFPARPEDQHHLARFNQVLASLKGKFSYVTPTFRLNPETFHGPLRAPRSRAAPPRTRTRRVPRRRLGPRGLRRRPDDTDGHPVRVRGHASIAKPRIQSAERARASHPSHGPSPSLASLGMRS